MIGGLGDGEAVAGWQMVELGSCCDLYQPSTLSKKELDPAGDIPVYGANGIIGFHSAYNHEEPEVLLACRGNVGTVNVSTGPAWINGNAMVCRPRDLSLSKPYLAYALQAVDLGPAISGTAQLQITRKSLSPIQIPICETYEQGVIVRILDTQLARLDAVLSAVQAARDRVSDLYRSANELVSKGSWPRLPLGELCELRNGIFVSRPSESPPGTPILRISAVRPSNVDLTDIRYASVEPAKASKSFVQEGDLLFTRYNGNPSLVGACGVVEGLENPTLHPDKLIRGRVDQDVVMPWFVAAFLTSSEGRHQIRTRIKTSAGQVGIAGSQLKSVLVPVPPLSVQRRGVEAILSLRGKAKPITSRLEEVELQVNRLRRSLLQAAFTGELTKMWREANG